MIPACFCCFVTFFQALKDSQRKSMAIKISRPHRRNRKLKTTGASGDFNRRTPQKLQQKRKVKIKLSAFPLLKKHPLCFWMSQNYLVRRSKQLHSHDAACVWERGAKLCHKGEIVFAIVERRRPWILPDNGESLARRTTPRSWKDKLYQPDNGDGVCSFQLCLHCVQHCAHFY